MVLIEKRFNIALPETIAIPDAGNGKPGVRYDAVFRPLPDGLRCHSEPLSGFFRVEGLI